MAVFSNYIKSLHKSYQLSRCIKMRKVARATRVIFKFSKVPQFYQWMNLKHLAHHTYFFMMLTADLKISYQWWDRWRVPRGCQKRCLEFPRRNKRDGWRYVPGELDYLSQIVTLTFSLMQKVLYRHAYYKEIMPKWSPSNMYLTTMADIRLLLPLRHVERPGGGAVLEWFARPRSWHSRAWRGNPNSYRDILGVSELVFSSPTTLLEEAWSNSKKLYNKNFKVKFCISLNPEMKLKKTKLEISYYAKNVLANNYFIRINLYSILSNIQKEIFKKLHS